MVSRIWGIPPAVAGLAAAGIVLAAGWARPARGTAGGRPPGPLRAPTPRAIGSSHPTVGQRNIGPAIRYTYPKAPKNPPTRAPANPIDPIRLERPAIAPIPTAAKHRTISWSSKYGRKNSGIPARMMSPRAARIVTRSAERGFRTVAMVPPTPRHPGNGHLKLSAWF